MSEQVNYSEREFLAEVVDADDEFYKDDIAYEWSNGRKHLSTDRYDTGVYDGS